MTGVGFAKRRSQLLQETRQRRVLLPIGFDHRAQPAQFLNGSLKLLLVDGLQQVIDRIRFKCAQGVLVVCSGEDDEGLSAGASRAIRSHSCQASGYRGRERRSLLVRTVRDVQRVYRIGRGACDVHVRECERAVVQAVRVPTARRRPDTRAGERFPFLCLGREADAGYGFVIRAGYVKLAAISIKQFQAAERLPSPCSGEISARENPGRRR